MPILERQQLQPRPGLLLLYLHQLLLGHSGARDSKGFRPSGPPGIWTRLSIRAALPGPQQVCASATFARGKNVILLTDEILHLNPGSRTLSSPYQTMESRGPDFLIQGRMPRIMHCLPLMPTVFPSTQTGSSEVKGRSISSNCTWKRHPFQVGPIVVCTVVFQPVFEGPSFSLAHFLGAPGIDPAPF